MNKSSKNKGISFIELLIAITIFSILIIPITTKLISSMEINSKSKEKQYVSDFAEQAMEYFKSYDFENVPTLTDEDGNKVQLTSSGKIENTITVIGKTVTYYDYEYSTSLPLGPKNREYDCTVNLSTKDYALRAAGYEVAVDADGNETYVAATSTIEDPNAINLGNVKSLDGSVDAIFTDTANYDSSAENYIYASKIDRLKMLAEEDPREGQPAYDNWNKYLDGTYKFDTNHIVDKTTRIVIEKSTTGYNVRCDVEYRDAYSEYQVDPVVYTVATYTYKNKPDIYLMFNQCMYNELYCNDGIVIDNSNAGNEDYNIYIIETYGDTDAGDVAKDENGNDITGNKIYEILEEEAPNATKSDTGEYISATTVKKSKNGYYPYDNEVIGKDEDGKDIVKYQFHVYVNTTTSSNQDHLKIYASDSEDIKYNLYGRIDEGVTVTDFMYSSGGNKKLQTGVLYKLSEESRLSEYGSLFTVKVLLDSKDESGTKVTLNGTKGGN